MYNQVFTSWQRILINSVFFSFFGTSLQYWQDLRRKSLWLILWLGFSLGWSWIFFFALRSIDWINWYLEWRNRELGYTNPREALEAFLAKWVIVGMLARGIQSSNFLCYKLSNAKPSPNKKWHPNMFWSFVNRHKQFASSKMWGLIGQTWKKMAFNLYYVEPNLYFLILHPKHFDGTLISRGGFLQLVHWKKSLPLYQWYEIGGRYMG